MYCSAAVFWHGIRLSAASAWRTGLVATAILFALFAGLPVLQADELRETFDAHSRHGNATVDHSAWDLILEQYVRPGEDGLNRVDYASLKRDGLDKVKDYIGRLEAIDPARLTVDEQFAFWVNLYNAKTAAIVARHYPVDSIRDIRLSLNPFSGPWKAAVTTVAGQKLSLDDIEHGILRPVWKDPRIHYAVNCASIGCPNLAVRAYTGSRLEEMLDRAAKAYVNSPRGAQFNDGRLSVSSLYEWYASDFGKNPTEILAHIGRYAKAPLAELLRNANQIDSYHYDWMLNDAK